jgi:DNA polymerase-3 subunit alpha
VLVFPEAWAAIGDRVRPDIPVLLNGGYSRRDQDAESATFIVEGITRLAELRAGGDLAVAIEFGAGDDLVPGVMDDVRRMLEQHEGSAPLEVRWRDGVRDRPVVFRSRTVTVAPTPLALSDLRALLGADRVRLVRTGG